MTERPGWLFVLPWSPDHVGGVNQVVRSLYLECASRSDFRPLLMFADWSASRPAEQGYSYCRGWRLRLRPPPAGQGLVSWVRYAGALPVAAFRLARWLRQEQVAVVNFHYPSLSIWPVILLKRLGLFRGKVVLSFHGTDVEALASQMTRQRGYWQRIVQHASEVVPSAFLADRLSRHLPGAAIRVVPNGVCGMDAVVPGREEDACWLSQAPASPFLLHIGKFGTIKGQDMAIRIFAGIADRYPELSLLLVGSGAADECRAMAESFGVSHRVHLLRDVPHSAVLQLMRRATVLLSCSRFESFGLVIIEAGLMHLPVVAMAVGGIPELIRDGENGLLCPPEDEAAAALAVCRVLDDDRFAMALADRLQQEARQRYSWQAAYDGYLKAVQ